MAMTKERVLFAVQQIETSLRTWWPDAIPHQAPEVLMKVNRAGHMLWMCKTIPVFLQEGRWEKAMRWLGFLQGAAWAMHVRTVEEMKQDNKPEDADL